MRHPRTLSYTLAVFILFGVKASADPISLTIEEFGAPAVDSGLLGSSSVTVPDVAAGGTFAMPGYGQYGDGYNWPAQGLTIDQGFGFQATWHPPGTSPTTRVQVDANGRATGLVYLSPGEWDNLYGGYQGTASSVSVYSNDPSITVPPELLDLVNHPERVHVSGSVGGGRFNTVTATLTIDPESPGPATTVPEPTTLAVFGLAAAGLAFWRRRCIGQTN